MILKTDEDGLCDRGCDLNIHCPIMDECPVRGKMNRETEYKLVKVEKPDA